MTILSNTFTRFDAIGVREDLSDIIYNIDPTETPFMQNCKRGSADQTFYEWQTDSLAAAVTTNHQIEGDDLGTTGYDAVTATVRLGNYTQISRKTLVISNTEEIVNKAGRKSEIAYQLAKKGRELRRDMEKDLLSNHGASAGSTSAARVTAALPAFLKTNISKDAGGVNPVYTNIPTDVRTPGSTRALTEALVKTVIELCWENGANPRTLMVGGTNKQTISGFSGVVELTSIQKAAPATIIGAADAYVSDFGTLAVVPNRFQAGLDCWVLDFDYLAINYLRPFRQFEMARTGDAEKRMMVVEYGLHVGNERAEGLVTDLTS